MNIELVGMEVVITNKEHPWWGSLAVISKHDHIGVVCEIVTDDASSGHSFYITSLDDIRPAKAGDAWRARGN